MSFSDWYDFGVRILPLVPFVLIFSGCFAYCWVTRPLRRAAYVAKFCFILAFCATIVSSQYQQVHEAAKDFQSLRRLSTEQVDCILLNQVKLSHPEAVLQALQHARRHEPSSVPRGLAATLEIRFKGGGSRSLLISKLGDSNRCMLELIEVTPGCISFQGEGVCPELPAALEKSHRRLMKVGQVL